MTSTETLPAARSFMVLFVSICKQAQIPLKISKIWLNYKINLIQEPKIK
jgi:hypothetical protein